jgi:hypothetical protein
MLNHFFQATERYLGGPILYGTSPNWWLSNPLKNMSSSDWIIIPNLVGENNIHVPNHQPVTILIVKFM